MPSQKAALYNDFYAVKKQVYDYCGFTITELNTESESREYGACTFILNKKRIVFRASKITPNKTGQFVTIWKRNNEGITEPFNENDEFDFVVISSRNDHYSGQFIFPKRVLIEKAIITANNKQGKRGIRLYPPWDKPANKQAEKTQAWQRLYFLPIEENGSVDPILAGKLYATN